MRIRILLATLGIACSSFSAEAASWGWRLYFITADGYGLAVGALPPSLHEPARNAAQAILANPDLTGLDNTTQNRALAEQLIKNGAICDLKDERSTAALGELLAALTVSDARFPGFAPGTAQGAEPVAMDGALDPISFSSFWQKATQASEALNPELGTCLQKAHLLVLRPQSPLTLSEDERQLMRRYPGGALQGAYAVFETARTNKWGLLLREGN